MKKVAKVALTLALVSLLVVALVACVPTDYSKAEKNLKDADYIANSSVFEAIIALSGIEGVEHVVAGTKGSDSIVLVYFDTTGHAKDAMDKLEKAFEGKLSGDDSKVARSGKVVYAGTKQAIKDVK